MPRDLESVEVWLNSKAPENGLQLSSLNNWRQMPACVDRVITTFPDASGQVLSNMLLNGFRRPSGLLLELVHQNRLILFDDTPGGEGDARVRGRFAAIGEELFGAPDTYFDKPAPIRAGDRISIRVEPGGLRHFKVTLLGDLIFGGKVYEGKSETVFFEWRRS